MLMRVHSHSRGTHTAIDIIVYPRSAIYVDNDDDVYAIINAGGPKTNK